MRMNERLFWATASTFLVLIGCAAPSTSDLVPDKEAAISIAIQKCFWKPVQGVPYERWRVALHHGRWHVWLSIEPGSYHEPTVGFLNIWIDAKSGEAEDCILAS